MIDQNNAPVVSIGEWIVTVLLTAIPFVNLVMLLIWGFGGGTNPSKANFAKASLIWMAIGLVFCIIFYVLFGAAMLAAMSAYSY